MIVDEKKAKEIRYVEPLDYLPKSLRKKYGLGEYSDEERESDTIK